MVPRIVFKELSLEDNIDIVKWFIKDMFDATVAIFPELSSIDLNGNKEDIDKQIEEVVTKHYELDRARVLSEIERYNNLWKDYNDKYMETLQSFFGVTFDVEEITAYVGAVPIFPRNLDDYSFVVGLGLYDTKAMSIMAHETLHFIWFKKFKEMYPEVSRDNFEIPHIEWEYSEMVTDPVLNNKPFNEIYNFNERGYDRFYKLYDGDTLVMDNLRNMYSKEEPVEDKIKEGFEYIKSLNNK